MITHQILRTIAYCHRINVAHRGLYPELILIGKHNSVRIIDFSDSHHFLDSRREMHTVRGSPHYIAPEVYSGKYDEKCDMWSLGVIVFAMLCGKSPFTSKND